jgi:hypothetical protein
VGSAALALSSQLGASGAPRLYVFANADMRAQALEKELEGALPGVDVTVFSRIRGFETALSERPEGLMARKPVLDALGLKTELQGQRGGRSTEPFVLLSRNAALSPAQLNGKTLGAVDILGRRNMEEFVSGLLGGAQPKLKHVTHERDLLALLQYDAVDAVITSRAWAQRLQEKSEMNLKTTPLSKEVGLPAVAFATGQARGVLEDKIKSAGNEFNQALEVSQWR